jgi:glycosyltransferase involved in cell wall biosynthesis
MKVSGFTFVRNGIKLGYPVKEAIYSILPLCDEVVVVVGNSDDGTLNFIRGFNESKIKIIESIWDDSLRTGGRILAVETNKALEQVSPDSDWAIYIQADEVLHEGDYGKIKEAMHQYKDNTSVEGLLFKYKHFYGSFDYVGESLRWYRREIRIIRSNIGVFSYRDAQGFRKAPNEKLRVKLIDAYVYHYGWVREPKAMVKKNYSFSSLYHTDEWLEKNKQLTEEYDYSSIDALKLFEGTHPAVMHTRIAAKNWTFTHDISKNKFSLKDRFKRFVEKYTGWRPGEYRNYRII